MRALIALAAAAVAVAATGCYHDKYGVAGSKREDYLLPPDQPRYTEPDTAAYRAPPPPKQQDTTINKGGGPGGRGGGIGGF